MSSDAPPPKAIRGGATTGLVAVLALAAVGGGIYLATQHTERPVKKDDALVQVSALARVEKDAEYIQRAIRERQAIVGMTFREVELAKGRPSLKLRAETLSDV